MQSIMVTFKGKFEREYRSSMETEENAGFLKKLETVIFPLAAAVIGIGYSIAILNNNPLERVLHSPHAIILLLILVSIAFFPLRALYKQARGQTQNRHDSD